MSSFYVCLTFLFILNQINGYKYAITNYITRYNPICMSSPRKPIIITSKQKGPNDKISNFIDDNIDNNDSIMGGNEPIYITEEELRSIWVLNGNSMSTYTELGALSLMDDDDDNEEEDNLLINVSRTSAARDISNSNNLTISQVKILLSNNKNKNNNNSRTSTISDLPANTNKLVGKSVGIDLGTTYSSVSVVEGGLPVIIQIDNSPLVPSIVAYLNENQLLVGESARRQQVLNSKNTFSSVKRVIGSSPKEARNNGEKLNLLKIDSSSTDICKLRSPALNNKLLLPEEISAQVLKYLLLQASQYLQQNITRAVITIPAYFKPNQIKATERAGYLAGLDKVKLLREPEAAALAYGLNRKQPQIVLVFDLGGGTLDCSILDVGGGVVEVKATSGDSHLGGNDFDSVIVKWLINQHVSNGGTDLSNNLFLLSRLTEAAEIAKKELSTQRSTRIQIPFLEGELGIDIDLSRSKFESLASKLISRLLKPLREVAIMSGVNLSGESGQLGYSEDDDDKDEGFGSNSVEFSATAMRKQQLQGRQEAKLKRKEKGSMNREIRRLQKEYSDPSIAVFPGGRVLDDVILVGGATRMPCVQRLLRQVTGIESKQSINPDEAVSLGAAVLAGIMDGDIKDMEVMSSWQAAMYRAFYEQQLIQKAQEGQSDTKKKMTIVQPSSDSKLMMALKANISTSEDILLITGEKEQSDAVVTGDNSKIDKNSNCSSKTTDTKGKVGSSANSSLKARLLLAKRKAKSASEPIS